MADHVNLVKWDQENEHFYETGVDRVVLYTYDSDPGDGEHSYDDGVGWNGVTGITESPSGAEETKLFANNGKYLALRSAEDFGLTLEAYTYPDEFAQCDGSASLMPGVNISQQTRKQFGLSYRTRLGNEVELDNFSYILHLVYGCTASPSEKTRQTVNDSPEATTFSWEITTIPEEVAITGLPEFNKSAHLSIDKSKLSTTALGNLETLEAALYGTDNGGTGDVTAYLPLPSEVYSILNATG